MGSHNYMMEKTLCNLNLVVMVYFLANHVHICLLFFIFRKRWIISIIIFSGRQKFISPKLITSEEVSCSLMFSTNCFACIKIWFFWFCKTACFRMQKATGKGHTSPGETFAEKKEVSHSSTTFTCRVSVATIDKKSSFFL